MPVDSASLNSPAGRISLPSASTRQPAATRSLVTCGHPLGGQLERARVQPRVLGLAEAQLEELDVGGALGPGVAADHQAQLGRDGQRRGPAGRDHGAVVVELQLADQLVGAQAPVLPGGPQRQAGPRLGVDLLEVERLDQLQGRHAGLGQDPAEHQVLLRLDEGDLLLVAQPEDPRHDAQVVEPGGPADAQDQQAGEQDQGLGEVHAAVRRGGASRATPIACRRTRRGRPARTARAGRRPIGPSAGRPRPRCASAAAGRSVPAAPPAPPGPSAGRTGACPATHARPPPAPRPSHRPGPGRDRRWPDPMPDRLGSAASASPGCQPTSRPRTATDIPRVGRGPLGLIQQGQDQAVLGVVLDVRGPRRVVPGPQRAPLAGRLALAAGQVDDDLVLRQRGGDVQDVDQQPLAVAVDGLGPSRAGPAPRPGAGSGRLGLGPAVPRGMAPLAWAQVPDSPSGSPRIASVLGRGSGSPAPRRHWAARAAAGPGR